MMESRPTARPPGHRAVSSEPDHPIFLSTCTSKAMTFSSQQAAGNAGMLAGGAWGCVPGFERLYVLISPCFLQSIGRIARLFFCFALLYRLSSFLCAAFFGCCSLALLPVFGRGAGTGACVWTLTLSLCTPFPPRTQNNDTGKTTTPPTERGGRSRAWAIKDSLQEGDKPTWQQQRSSVLGQSRTEARGQGKVAAATSRQRSGNVVSTGGVYEEQEKQPYPSCRGGQ